METVFDLKDFELPEKPMRTLRINMKAYAKIYYYTQAAPGEVSGWGRIRKDDDISHTVLDALILEQQCSGGYTDPLETALEDFKYYMYRYGKDPTEFTLWWHSHANFGVFLSGTDESTIAQYSQVVPLISLVVNKRGAMYARFNFQGYKEDMRVVIVPTGFQDVQHECYMEVEEKVSEFPTVDEDSVSGLLDPEFGVSSVDEVMKGGIPAGKITKVYGRVPPGCSPVIIRRNE